MRRPCRSHPSPPAAGGPLYVDTLDDAWFVVDASVAGPEFGAVALLLDDDDRLLSAVECAGCDHPERLVDLCSVLLAATPPDGAWQRCVLVSDRGADDAAVAWEELAARFADSPVELVDWLVVDLVAGATRSMAETVEGRSPW